MFTNTRYLVMVLALGTFLLAGTASAQASTVDDIPQALGDKIGVTAAAAGYVLSAMILMSAGLTLAVVGRKPNFMATAVVLIAICIALVVIGWLDYWVMFIIALFVAFEFAKAMKTTMTGG